MKNMKKKITEQYYIKANRKASREEEIKAHGKPLPKSKVHNSRKAYDRNKTKAGIKRLPYFFPQIETDFKCLALCAN